MDESVTIEELERRWATALSATRKAVVRHPAEYRQIKFMATEIVGKTIDINEYLPTAEKLARLLKTMDPYGRGSIFSIFNRRITPSSIWQVPLLRVECKDLLAYLKAFDHWRLSVKSLKIIK